MKASKKIELLKRDIKELFGPDDPVTRAVELREKYCKIGQEVERLRDLGYSYSGACQRVAEVFYCSEATTRRAVKLYATFTKMSVEK